MNRALLRLISIGLLLALLGITFLSLRTLRRLPEVTVYFVKTSATSFTLEPVQRLAVANTPQAKLEAAIEQLIAGPKPQELQEGLSSSFPEDTRLLGFDLSNSTARVNLSQNFEQGGGSATMQGRLNQLFYTLSGIDTIESISLEIEGQAVSSFSGQGLLIDNPWTRGQDSLPVW